MATNNNDDGMRGALRLLQQTAIDAETMRNDALESYNAIAMPGDYNIHRLEGLSEGRDRWRGTYTTPSMDDFARAAKEHEKARVFVDADNWTACAVFNYENSMGGPGHCDFRAKLQVTPAPEWTALLNLHGQRFNQRGLVEFIEDWAHCIPGFRDATDATVTMAQAIAAIRTVSVQSGRETHTVALDMKHSRGVMETIEARDADKFPSVMQWACVPALGLPPVTAVVRLSILTSHDTPTIAARVVALESLRNDVAKEFALMLQGKLEAGVRPFAGHFNAGD